MEHVEKSQGTRPEFWTRHWTNAGESSLLAELTAKWLFIGDTRSRESALHSLSMSRFRHLSFIQTAGALSREGLPE